MSRSDNPREEDIPKQGLFLCDWLCCSVLCSEEPLLICWSEIHSVRTAKWSAKVRVRVMAMDGCHGSWYISISLICNEISHSLGPKGDPTLMPKYPNKCGVCMQKIPLFRCPDGQVVLGRSGASLYTYNDSVGTSQVRSFCTHLRVRDRAVNTKKQELWSRQTWFKTCLYHLLFLCPWPGYLSISLDLIEPLYLQTRDVISSPQSCCFDQTRDGSNIVLHIKDAPKCKLNYFQFYKMFFNIFYNGN